MKGARPALCRNKNMKEIIEKVKGLGFKVYGMKEKTWIYFTDGKRIGYIQGGPCSFHALSVHVPSHDNGTGFQMLEFLDAEELTIDKLSIAFDLLPNFYVYNKEGVKKWKDWEAFQNSSVFNKKMIEL